MSIPSIPTLYWFKDLELKRQSTQSLGKATTILVAMCVIGCIVTAKGHGCLATPWPLTPGVAALVIGCTYLHKDKCDTEDRNRDTCAIRSLMHHADKYADTPRNTYYPDVTNLDVTNLDGTKISKIGELLTQKHVYIGNRKYQVFQQSCTCNETHSNHSFTRAVRFYLEFCNS